MEKFGAAQQQVSFNSVSQSTYAGVVGGQAHVGPGQHQQVPEHLQQVSRNSAGGQSHNQGVGNPHHNRVGRSARVQRLNSHGGHHLEVPQHPVVGGDGVNGRNR